MVEVYAVHVPSTLSKETYKQFLNAVSTTKRARIERFWKAEDAYRSLLADILIRTIVCEKFKFSNRDIHFEFNQYEKPYIPHLPHFAFNASHSGEWVVCATHSMDVGIDIERIRPIDMKIAHRFFSAKECSDLDSKQEKDRLSYFYDLWSLKESYIKAVGKGLSLPLHSFTIRKKDGSQDITFESMLDSENWYFKQYELDERYKLSVCAKENHFQQTISIEQVETLLQKIADHA
jgi:4'-phosphopantetheinyl transferase